CRNSRPALQRTVASVLPQLTREVEYWVVDGASTDGTPEWIASLASPGVRTLSEPDRGISDAMNKGTRLAAGGWVAHLHADDTYLPGTVAVVLDAIRADDADVLCGHIVKQEPGGEVLCR